MKSRFLIAGAMLCALALPLGGTQLSAQQAASAKAAFGAWGVDLGGGDSSVKPGDDFFRFASGKWYDANEISADRAAIGTFYDLDERASEQVKDLIVDASKGSKYGALYASFMDEKRIEAAGLTPLKRDLAAISAIKTKAQFARFMGASNGRFGISAVDHGVIPDFDNPQVNVLFMSQGGIGLPEREYYFSPQFEKQRTAYRAYIERTMRTIGNPDPKAAADTIMGFETEIAFKSWKVVDRRDLTKLNNGYSTVELAAFAPGIDWAAYFAGAGVPAQKRVIVAENTAIKAIAGFVGETPLATLKLWQQFHTAHQASPYLIKALVESRFDFIKSLSGVTENRPRWKRAVTLVDGSLGELVGQDYVAKYFPPSSKARMEALVANLKAAMVGRIKGNDWMSAPTKTAALDKLNRMDVMVGYPDKFRSYKALRIDPADLYGNVQRAGAFNAAYDKSFLGKKVDRKLWGLNPQTVNAYNAFLENKIVFPAGILQPPFFDPNADDAVNYGAIGAVIGHEISHGFDDQGRKADATGALRDWWAEADGLRFEERAKRLGEQYAQFEPLPGVLLDPKLTMGENIADLAGLAMALDAYQASLGGKPAPVIDGYSGEQRVFLAYAQNWRTKQREDALRQQVATARHSPARFRAIGPVRNLDSWYAAFGVKPGDKLYIAPADRARIW